MIFLVDTHVFLNWLLDPKKVSRSGARALQDSENQFRVSVMSLLESEFLAEIGRVEMRSGDLSEWIRRQESWEVVPFDTLALAQAKHVNTRDPFDRVIVATALAHGWRLLTRDPWMHTTYPKMSLG